MSSILYKLKPATAAQAIAWIDPTLDGETLYAGSDIRAAEAELQKRVAELERDIDRMLEANGDLVKELEQSKRQVRDLLNKKFAHFANEECWIYQGENDQLESLTCPVVISAAKLLELQKAASVAVPEDVLASVEMLIDHASKSETLGLCGLAAVECARDWLSATPQLAVSLASSDPEGHRQAIADHEADMQPTVAEPCPNASHMGEHACKDRSQCWEPCGELGRDERFVKVAEPMDSIPNNELPGMWDRSDFTGGSTEAETSATASVAGLQVGTMLCKACGADRAKEPCRNQDISKCAMQGVAQSVAVTDDPYYNLLGVIIDIEEGSGFDAVCLQTLKRVLTALAKKPAPLKVPSDEVIAGLWKKAIDAAASGTTSDLRRLFTELLLAEVQKGGSHD